VEGEWRRGQASEIPSNLGHNAARPGLSQPAYWQELVAFGKQDTSVKLASCAARKLGLPATAAGLLLREYLRYVYLTFVAGEQLAPSKQVDALWHEHIATGNHYFEQFGPDAAGGVLHHSPGRPHPSRDPAYARTLLWYRQEFDEAPPPTFWPPQHPKEPTGSLRGQWLEWAGTIGGSGLVQARKLTRNFFGLGNVATSDSAPLAPPSPSIPPLLTRLCADCAREGQGTVRSIARERLSLGDDEAQRLSLEYARFHYLLQSSPGPVVPPDIIRRLWSEHVLHTREYTEHFCPDVLRSVVFPNQVDAGSDPDEAAAQTRAEYQRAFDRLPPTDIWPGPEEFKAIRQAHRWSLAAFGVVALCVTILVVFPVTWVLIIVMTVCLLAVTFIYATLAAAYGALLLPGRGKSRNGDAAGFGCG
jgi:hypothetical protein